MRFKEFLSESVEVGQTYVTTQNMPAEYKATLAPSLSFPMTHITKGMKIRVKKVENGTVISAWVTNGKEDPDLLTTPLEDFEKCTITKREYDKQFLDSLKESVDLVEGDVYVFVKPVMAHEFVGDDPNASLGNTELGSDLPLDWNGDYRFKLFKLAEDEVWLKWADGKHDLWTYACNREEFQNSVITEREYKKRWFDSLKEAALTEMPAKAGEGPRAILAKIWKEECAKELGKMPIYKKHTTAGYRRKAKDEMVRMELQQFFELGNLRDLTGVKDQRGRKHDVKAIQISWRRPVAAWRGDGGIFKTKEDYMKMIPIMREVFTRFIKRVQESGLTILGYNAGYNSKEMFSWSAFDIEADLRREAGSIELFFEESDALLTKREIKKKLEQVVETRQVFKRGLVVDTDSLADDSRYRYRRRDTNDESIVIIPKTLIDDMKFFAGDIEGEQHMMSMVDPDSDAAREMENKLNAIRQARINVMPEKINRGRPELEKLLAQTNGAIENIASYSPYEITVKIQKPSDDSIEWLFRSVTSMEMRDYTRPLRAPDALKHQWFKNAEWLFIRIGDRKSVHPDGVEQVD